MPKGTSREAFVLFSCDIWKTRNSMGFLGVLTNFKKLQIAVGKLVKDDTFKCNKDRKYKNCKDCSPEDSV